MAKLELIPNVYMVLSQIVIFLGALFVVKRFFLEPFRLLSEARASFTTDLFKQAKHLEEQTQKSLDQIETRIKTTIAAAELSAKELTLGVQQAAQKKIAKSRATNEELVKQAMADYGLQKEEQVKLISKYQQIIAKEALVHLTQK